MNNENEVTKLLAMPKIGACFLPFFGFEEQLAAELGPDAQRWGNLFLVATPQLDAMWAQNTWQAPQFIEFDSIGDAVKKLTAIQPLWAPYIHSLARRSELIREKLPYVSTKRLKFGKPVPSSALGSFTLLRPNLMLASPKCRESIVNGSWEFEEDKETPPSRAYLKLWEVFSRMNIVPSQDSVCLEIGAAPGGWAWVLSQYCQKLFTIDRAPLAPQIASLKNISHKIGNAFTTKPTDYPEIDWIFSDIIAYPPKLLDWLEPWLKGQKACNFVCTIKLQDRKHYQVIEDFAKIPGSKLFHLYHNKHELTWILLRNQDKLKSLR